MGAASRRAYIVFIGIRTVQSLLPGAVIAKLLPFVKDLQRISCKSFTIMQGADNCPLQYVANGQVRV
ncbi:MAG: hypothetical protein ACRDOI_43540, partial [Trebonia sp.]